MIILKSEAEIAKIREGGEIASYVLNRIRRLIRPGVTTGFLDKIAHNEVKKMGASPAFLGYRGFPASICTSINYEVIHGIPNSRRLKEGDIVKIDIGILHKGYYADAADTFCVGKVGGLAKRLISVARKALDVGISKAKKGNRIRDISSAIQKLVEIEGFSVVRAYCGHGIGKELHEEPEVPNFVAEDCNVEIKPGMVFCIEPMINAGTPDIEVLSDGWTVVTRDRKLSVHTEHMVAITERGTEILT
jgi:methionyl aminopeptidase